MAKSADQLAHVAENTKGTSQRQYISQADVPSFALEKALRIPTAIAENYGYKPTTPLQVAKALDITPTSSNFKMMTGAAIAYGLTSGGYNADLISITNLGLRMVRPTAEGDDLLAKREALLKPRVIREFLTKYDGAPLPKDVIAINVLQDMGVPRDRAGDVLSLILEGAESVGFLQTIKDRKYVELGNPAHPASDEEGDERSDGEEEPTAVSTVNSPIPISKPTPVPIPVELKVTDSRERRVFITHGKNTTFIEPIKELLKFGELDAIVAQETQTVSQPVPEKVLALMRSCGAAIIHVEDERHLLDKDAKEHIMLNENVLIEIGAAMALYDRRYILVVKEGVRIPSNLQGLSEVRYTGESLDSTATINLLKAIKDMKGRPLP